MSLFAILEIVLPIVLGGSAGGILGVLNTPAAGVIAGLGKSVAQGNHLSADEKRFVKNYNDVHGYGPGGDAYAIMNRWR